MKERGPWRLWSMLLLLLAGSLCNSVVQSQSYDGARGDSGDGNAAGLGFSDVVRRHDGYVKGETPTIPQTSFSCSAQPYNPGLYADVETQCQVYHVCFEDRQESFLCGPGTNFNQRILACDFWYNFDCQDAPNFYSVNADIGKVPEQSVFRPGQGRQPGQVHQTQQPQRPSYPSFPQQPAQPPSGGSIPNRVSVPPPPSRPVPQPPRIQPYEPVQPQPPRIQPYEPVQPQPPRIPQEPIQPQLPRIPQEPIQPQPPRFTPQPQQPAPRPQQPASRPQPPAPRPQPPAPRPQPPRIQPQPPRVYPEPAPRPQPPAFRPQSRPEPPRVSGQPTYPRTQTGSGQHTKVRPPPPQQLPPTQQEEDAGYQFDGYIPPRVSLPPPPPPRHTPKPIVFPPVVSPPRVSRPPLTPPIIQHPGISRPGVPTIDTRSEFHPDSHLKGNVGYQPPQQPRVPQPSRPVGSGYPSYPVPQRPSPQVSIGQRPAEKPRRPAYQPPASVQQEHVETEYVPPPPPPPPREPSRPSTTYVPPPPPPPREPSRPSTTYVPPPPPPPPRPVQQEVTNVGFTKPPQRPSRPAYVPPPVAQKPVINDYDRPQPPVSPSIIREQRPVAPPPSRPQVSVGGRQPQPPSRPKPVFPPASDHPNSNIKGGPGYNQPPPQVPRFEPTRISRPSSPQGGYQPPPQALRPRPVSTTAVKPAVVKTPTATGQGSYKPTQDRVKKPSDPPRTVYQPPIQVIQHPQSEIKGVAYDPPRQPPRIQAPSIPVSGVKRPQISEAQRPQVQRPRAPVVVSRPQPPSLPTTSIKKTSPPADTQVYEKPRPQPPAPGRIKQPSTSHVQSVSRPSQPRFPTYEDHPNANVKGGSGYNQQQLQPIRVSRPSGPPPAPSTSYEQKTPSSNQGRGSGGGYPSYPSRGDSGSIQQVIQHDDYKPSRSSPPSSVKTVQKITHVKTEVKDTSSYQRPPASSQHNVHSVLINKQSKPDYEAGSRYTRGPETYPKPEFGKPNTPVSTPSRVTQTVKTGSPSQNTITRSENKPTHTRPSVSTGSGSGSDIRPQYPFNQVPGHQPPHERQVFPHRENPDHPNESIKGSGAYRPPPPAGFQAAASEVEEQKVVPEPEPDTASLHGDTGVDAE